ncbi:MAG: pyridoxine 5'-phosphate synthase [Gammaproteobacteria bacterium]|nr:pyridoxine 5'-phosphate synthase [Gammaproteobacteria bacterium]
MTKLSVNVNKIALLRNSRGTDYPNLRKHAERLLELGAHGITVHPRQDERHIKYADVPELAALLVDHANVEFNVEGYPSDSFLALVEETRPDQCTLVPDSATQLTSDHGWDMRDSGEMLHSALDRLRASGIRSALFMDPDVELIAGLQDLPVDRIELYTEPYAHNFGKPDEQAVLQQYREAARFAQDQGLGINAGHDLNLQNLAALLEIPDILEVSIGHALTVEALELGIAETVARYLKICSGAL